MILITGFSCSKDSVNPPIDLSADFTGNWVLYSYHYSGITTTIYEDSATQTQFTGIGFEILLNTFFSEDPNNYTSNGQYAVEHIVTDEDGNQYLYLRFVQINDIGTWTRQNNSITLNVDGESLQGFISELTEDTLKITINSTTTDLIENNVERHISQTENYVFVRNL